MLWTFQAKLQDCNHQGTVKFCRSINLTFSINQNCYPSAFLKWKLSLNYWNSRLVFFPSSNWVYHQCSQSSLHQEEEECGLWLFILLLPESFLLVWMFLSIFLRVQTIHISIKQVRFAMLVVGENNFSIILQFMLQNISSHANVNKFLHNSNHWNIILDAGLSAKGFLNQVFNSIHLFRGVSLKTQTCFNYSKFDFKMKRVLVWNVRLSPLVMFETS